MSTEVALPGLEVPVIDESRLMAEFGGDAEILAELRDLFLEHAPPLYEAILQAIETRDLTVIASDGHSLKGACATFGPTGKRYPSEHHLLAQKLWNILFSENIHLELAGQYRIQPYPGHVTLMRPSDAPVEIATTPDRGWQQLAREVDVRFVPGQHHSMVKEPYVQVLAQKLNTCLG